MAVEILDAIDGPHVERQSELVALVDAFCE